MIESKPASLRLKIQNFSHTAAFVCAILFMIFIPINIVLMNVFLFLTLIFILATGNIMVHAKTAWSNPVARFALILFMLLFIGTIWSIAETSWAFRVLKKYNELWYIALLLPIFCSAQRREIGIQSFLISMSAILMGIYLVYFDILPDSGFTIASRHVPFSVDGGFSSHIMTNILMSFVVFVSAHKFLQCAHHSKRWLYLFLFLASGYYTLFISTGTTGQIITFLLLILLSIQHFKKQALIAIPFTMLVIGIMAHTVENNSIQHALKKIESRIADIENSNPNTRPQLIIHASKLFLEDPIIGTGTGSYKTALEIKQPDFYQRTVHKWNPHNEYLTIAVQLGIVGLLALLYLFYLQGFLSKKIQDTEQRHLAQGLVLLFSVGCLANSLIMDSGEGHFWAFFSALFFSNLIQKSDQLYQLRR